MTERIGALPKDIKAMNDREILRTMVDMKTFTVQEISDRTQISRLTITRAIERFIEKEIIVAGGKGASTKVGGKKPREYMLNQNRYVISVCPVNGKTVYSLLAFDGTVAEERYSGFPADMGYEDFIEDVCVHIEKLMRDNRIERSDVKGIEFCFGGIIDRREGIVRIPSIPKLSGPLPVVEDIRKRIGEDIPVEIENVSKVSSGVLRFTDDIRQKRTAFMYADYGVSIVMLDDGFVPETSHNVNGELGHMCLDPSDPEVCVCGSRGCFEMLIAERRLMKMIDALPAKTRTELMKDHPPGQDIRVHLLEKRKENKAAEELCCYMAKHIGLAFRNVYLGFDPDFFILAGVFAHADDGFLEQIREVIRENQYLRDINIDIEKENRDLKDLLRQGSLNLVLSSLLEEERE